MSDDESDDDLLTTPVFRSSDRRRTLAQKKTGNAIEELIRNSKLQLEEARRIQQLQAGNNQAEQEFDKIIQEESSAVKRKVEATQSGFFLVEEDEQMDVPERKRRATMLDRMKGQYDPVVDAAVGSKVAFQTDATTEPFFYNSSADCIEALRPLLGKTKNPKLQQALISDSNENLYTLDGVMKTLPLQNDVPTDIAAWMFRGACSEGLGNVRCIGKGASHALVSLMRRGSVDLSDPVFQMDPMNQILGCWGSSNEKGGAAKLSGNKEGLTNFLSIVALMPLRHKVGDATAIEFQKKLTDLCVSFSKANGHRDVAMLAAAERVQALLSSTRSDVEENDIEQLAARITKDPQSVANPWHHYPSVAKLVPYFCSSDKMLDTTACTMNVHLSMQALRHCLEGNVVLEDLLVAAFERIDGVEGNVDLEEKSLPLKAMASSYAAMEALQSHFEGLYSVKEAHSQRCFAVGQAAMLAFTSGLLLLGSTMQEEDGGKEYGTRENMRFVYCLCDKLAAPLDFLTSYSNRYSADEHFRRLNCWLMVLDFYRLETLKKLKPRFDDDTLVQKNLTSFFTKIST